MKPVTKGNRIFVLCMSVATVLFAIMLPLTAEEILPSESAYAGAPNQRWYILMHISMIMLFYFLNAINRGKKLFGVAAFASLIVLGLDMYGYKMPHNIATAILFIVASYCMIFYTFKDNRLAKIITISALGINFGVAVVLKDTDYFMTVYLAEIIIQTAFGAILTVDTYKREFWG